MKPIVNISSYKFVHLTDLELLQTQYKQRLIDMGLCGTIYISHEGVNLNLCGSREAIDRFIQKMEADDRFHGMDFKESYTDDMPFSKTVVRIRDEIIAMEIPGLDPESKPTAYITAETLKQWYDEGKAFTILDTRNDYEVAFGHFENAKQLDIKTFKQFPDMSLTTWEAIPKDQPVVTYCTGGVRCEKAGPWMEQQGFKEVYQLQGGILKYFERVGGEHWEGECFVFDDRIAVDSALAETGTAQCKICSMPVSVGEQQGEQYKEKAYCPHCFDAQESV